MAAPILASTHDLWRHARPDGTCLRWLATRPNPKGYRSVRLHHRRWLVHRLAYVITHGPIPPGWQVDHSRARGCQFYDCINPWHLEAVPAEENRRRQSAWKATCRNGHDYAINAIRDGAIRRCGICRSEQRREAEYRRRQRRQVAA